MNDLLWRDFTEQEKERIDYMVKTGYGWSKYARSLKKQSKISAKQSKTLNEMYCRLYSQQSRHRYKPPDVSDYRSWYYDV